MLASTLTAPTTAPLRPFLDWRVVTDPAQWAADIALLGVTHSEPYPGDPQPNDQTRAPMQYGSYRANSPTGPATGTLILVATSQSLRLRGVSIVATWSGSPVATISMRHG